MKLINSEKIKLGKLFLQILCNSHVTTTICQKQLVQSHSVRKHGKLTVSEFSTFTVFDFKIHINRTLIVFVMLPEQRAGVLLEGS